VARIDLQSLDAPARKLAFDAALRRFRRSPLGIVVPPSQVLRKRVALPLAAKDNLRQVLAFELNRHTPFQADQAYFDYRLLDEDAKANRLDVQLTVAPRLAVDECLTLLRNWRRTPRAIVAADELAAGGRYANLLPPELRPGIGAGRVWIYAAMTMLALALAIAAFAVPLWQKREVVLVLDRQVKQAKQRTEAIEILRRQLDAASGEYQFLLERKAKRPAVVEVLEEITNLLPDDTWLNQLEIKGGEAIISGATESSARLIRLLEKSDLLEEPSFRSPLVKGRDAGERFQMALRLRDPRAAGKSEATAEAAAKAPAAAPADAGKVKRP
jgi:general secretion pathway protein L